MTLTKVVVLNGDIVKEDFGLNKIEYKNLKSIITTVINSAADVRHYGKYEDFFNTNVVSVENILKFCEYGISIAHISTLSIAWFKNSETIDKVFDKDTLYIKQALNK